MSDFTSCTTCGAVAVKSTTAKPSICPDCLVASTPSGEAVHSFAYVAYLDVPAVDPEVIAAFEAAKQEWMAATQQTLQPTMV